jgi:hypothetical protein
LLRLILTSHSRVLIPPECGFIIWLQKNYANWQEFDNNDSARLETFIDDLFACKKFDTWLLDKGFVKGQIALHKPANYAELCAVIYAAFGMNNGKKFSIWGDKNNFHLNHLYELLGLYKNARFLHIVRDGRDVACSYRDVMAAKSKSPYAPKLDTQIASIALEWSNNVTKVDSFMTLMPHEIAMTIKYEDLVSHSRSCMTAICEWLDIPFETDMLNFYQQNKSKKLEPESTMDWKKRTLQPISDDTLGRYAGLLSKQEQEEFWAVAASALHRFSYA